MESSPSIDAHPFARTRRSLGAARDIRSNALVVSDAHPLTLSSSDSAGHANAVGATSDAQCCNTNARSRAQCSSSRSRRLHCDALIVSIAAALTASVRRFRHSDACRVRNRAVAGSCAWSDVNAERCMTRSDDSRSSGGSATDPLIPAHPDASSRSSLGNAPFAPRAAARPALRRRRSRQRQRRQRLRARVCRQRRDALIRHPGALRQFQLGYGSTPASSTARGARPGPRRARPRRIPRGPRTRWSPRGTGRRRAKNTRDVRGGRHATSAATKRDGRDVGVRRGHGREARDGEIAGGKTRPRARRRHALSLAKSRQTRAARAASREPSRSRIKRRNSTGRASHKSGAEGSGREAREGAGAGMTPTTARRQPRPRSGRVRAVPPWRGRGEPPRRRRRIDRTGRRRPRGFRGEGVAEHLQDLGRARPREAGRVSEADAREGCPPGPSRDADGGEDGRSRSANAGRRGLPLALESPTASP